MASYVLEKLVEKIGRIGRKSGRKTGRKMATVLGGAKIVKRSSKNHQNQQTSSTILKNRQNLDQQFDQTLDQKLTLLRQAASKGCIFEQF